MAKVRIAEDAVHVSVGWLERTLLAERSRRLPLSRIRSVDAHPPVQEMMLHWSAQSGVWLCGVSAYDGEMIPSAKHPSNTIAIELAGDERVYVEVDDESPAQVAERIACALRVNRERSEEEAMATTTWDPSSRAANAKALQSLEIQIDDEEDDEDVQLRDPLLQGSLPPPPTAESAAADKGAQMNLDDDRDLTRLGGWLVGLGSLGLLTGGIMLASGALPGLLAVGAGVTCALLGGVALAVVAHHQG